MHTTISINDKTLITDTYINTSLTDEQTKVYYPCCLPFRTEMVLKNRFGKHVVTKEFINCVADNAFSYRRYGEIGLCGIKLASSVNNKVVLSNMEVYKDSATGQHKLTLMLNNLYYEVVSIDGKDPMFYAPHLKLLGL